MKTNPNRSTPMASKAALCAWICFTILALLSFSSMAGTVTSAASGGLWTATTTWSGGAVPAITDDVVIATVSGSQVTLNTSTTVANVTINTGATLGLNNDNVNNRTLTISGSITNGGTITLGTGGGTGPTARFTFTAAAHTWVGSGDTSGVKLRMDIPVGGSLDISGLTTPLKWRSGTGSQPLAVSGTFITGTQVLDNNGNTAMTVTFGASSSLITANPNGIIAPTGTFGNTFASSQFTWTAGASVTFNGTSGQVTTGLPATISNLAINNSGAGVTLSQATTVSGILALTSGKLTTTPANLLTIGSAGTISGGSATSYVNGPLAQAYSGALSKDFPIGVSPNYRKVTLNITTASGAPTITITPHEPSTFGCTTPAGYAVSSLRDWTVAGSVAGPQTATLTVDATGYATASTLIQCVGGASTVLATTGTWPALSAAGLSVGTTQEYALGEACASSAPALTSVSDSGPCTSVAVTWVTDGTSSYKVYRKTGAGAYGLLASGLTFSPYNDPTAVGNTTYTYAISALAPCGAESDKAEFSPYTTTAGKPAAPAQPTITANCGSLTVNWGAVSGATSYNVYRKLSTDPSYGAAIATGQTATSYQDSGASDSAKTYIYAVAGFETCEGFLSPDSAGASPSFAPSISTSPAAAVTNLLGTTSTLALTATGTGLTYQWQVDKGSGFANAIETTDGTGSASASFTTVTSTTGMSGYRYQCVVSGTCAPPVTNSPTTLYPVIYVRSAASGSFASSANFEMSLDGLAEWVPANGAPNSNSVTTIRSGHSLTNSNPSERQVRSLTIDAGGIFVMGNGGTTRNLGIFGSLTNNGSFLAGVSPSAGAGGAQAVFFRANGNWVGSGDISGWSGNATNNGGTIAVTVDSGVTLDISGLTNSIKLSASNNTPFTVNGMLNAGHATIDGNGRAGSAFILASGATLVSANPNGLTGAGATLNFLAAPSLSTAANYTLNGSGTQSSAGLPATVNNLTIANTANVSLSQAEVVNGTLAVNAGAILDFNSFTIATTNPCSLNGALTMEVTKTGPNAFTGSKLTQTVSPTLTYGGALTVTAGGLALAVGDAIPLFSSAGYAGVFSSVTGPVTPAGLARDISQLTGGTGGNITFGCDGTLAVTLASQNNVTCNGGNNGGITANTATGGGGGYTYAIDGVNYQADLAFGSLIAGSYTLTAKDTVGCVSPGVPVIISQPAALVASAGASKTICAGSSVAIGGSPTASGGTGPYGCLWSPATGLDSPTNANPNASPASSTLYTVTVTDANGCVTSSQATVTVNPLPTTSAITGPTSVNANEAGVHYWVSLTSGSSYAWTVPAGASITSGSGGPNNNEIVVTFGTSSGDVAAVETSAAGCAGSPVSLAVTVQSRLPVTITDIQGASLSYSGGAGTRFILLSSPAAEAPMGAWAPVKTNSFTPGTFTIPAVGSSTQLFYRIQSE